MTMTTTQCAISEVPPAQTHEWMNRGEAVVVDVREPFEYAAERIEGTIPLPMSDLDFSRIPEAREGQRIIFQCRTGSRSGKAAMLYLNEKPGANVEVCNLAGGLVAWKEAGLPVYRAPGAPKIDVMRQVQITAGALILIGVLLGAFVSEWFLILSGFVGGGLMFAGLSGWCGMAKLLAFMPWNRVKGGCC